MVTKNSINSGIPIEISLGGTNTTSFTTTYGTVCFDGTQLTTVTAGSSGQVLTSNGSGGVPSYQYIGAEGLAWSEITGATQTAAVNSGYICNRGSLITITLPATAAQGSIVHVVGKGAGGWSLVANTGQTIQFGDQATSTAGSVSSTDAHDAFQVICITADTSWSCTGASQGNLTIA
jgi:hypothetical protein